MTGPRAERVAFPRSSRLPGRVLPVGFYARDTRTVARELLGCILARFDEHWGWSWGRIVETEAYRGESDPACHGAAGLTPRTRVLYGRPGRSYVYFSYGMHFLFNAVTETDGFPAAVLVRALEPLGGLERIRANRGGREEHEWTSGPGRLCSALGITLDDNALPLQRPPLVLRSDGRRPERVETGPRVGIRKGVDRRWRFWVAGSRHVSRARPGPPSRRRRPA